MGSICLVHSVLVYGTHHCQINSLEFSQIVYSVYCWRKSSAAVWRQSELEKGEKHTLVWFWPPWGNVHIMQE